ncbi:MAG: ABC transporter permease [Bacteroidota bacterium]|jgi:putative ABC transport system permease protein|nr:FtsX-like permease family protein [Bacteroidia bacterium]NBY10674.1 FtsX-like permease family protein [Sphingobacteriia bacterium]
MYLIIENIKVAFNALRSNRLRTFITMSIIATGLTALMGILSAIEAIKNGINSNFSNMGANTFTIRNQNTDEQPSAHPSPPIRYQEAVTFCNRFPYACQRSISTQASFTAKVEYLNTSTNPNIRVIGCNGEYLKTAGYTMLDGRFFTTTESGSSAHLVVLGKEVAEKLFANRSPLHLWIKISGQPYKIIGVLESRGSSGFGGDKCVLIPLATARQYFSKQPLNYNIHVIAAQSSQLAFLTQEARACFRAIRNIKPEDEDTFELVKSDRFAKLLIENIHFVTLGATIIGLITLLGSAIGLMNIMLVSVTERTREIGIRKAMGATSATIRNQFLIESILIGLFGGAMGILAGIGIGNAIGLILGNRFFIPWFWITIGFTICIGVGLISGFVPAKNAAALDPIEALRFE